MGRLIDADALLNDDEIKANFDSLGVAYIKLIVKEQPTVDPIKHGYLKMVKSTGKYLKDYYVCSVCGSANRANANFCNNCGAAFDADRPPKGKWRLLNGKWTCSECGNTTDWPLKICNVCASEMEIEL